VPLDPVARYRFADGSGFDAAERLDALYAALDGLAPGNGADWRAFTERAERVWEASREPFLESALHGPSTIASLALRRPADIAAIAPGRSLRSLGRRHLRDPRLRMFLDRYATYTGSDPRRAPAALAAVRTPSRPSAAGTSAAACTASASPSATGRWSAAPSCGTVPGGADPHRRRAVSGVSSTAARCCRRRRGGQHRRRHVYGSLVDAPVAARRLARAEPSLSGFVLLLAGRGPHARARAPQRACSPPTTTPSSTRSSATRPVRSRTRRCYVSAPDDPAVRPDGCEAWFVLVNAAPSRHGRGAVDWRRQAGRVVRDSLLDLLAARGLPVRDRVRWSQVLSPADLEERTGASAARSTGRRRTARRRRSCGRPTARPCRAVPRRRLVAPGGGLPLVTLSAQIVAGLVGPA
jgi:phytoene dehydrogenase-like protein